MSRLLLNFGPNAFNMGYVPYKDAISTMAGSKYVLKGCFGVNIFSFFYFKIHDDMIILIRSICFVTMYCGHRLFVRALLTVYNVCSQTSTGYNTQLYHVLCNF